MSRISLVIANHYYPPLTHGTKDWNIKELVVLGFGVAWARAVKN